MGALMKAHKGEFDGKEANPWVGEMLGKAAASVPIVVRVFPLCRVAEEEGVLGG